MFDIQEELKKLPQKPGVYLMKDENGHIIYGEGSEFETACGSIFKAAAIRRQKTRSMVPNIREFEYIVTDSEMEALLLECNLIKSIIPIIIFF